MSDVIVLGGLVILPLPLAKIYLSQIAGKTFYWNKSILKWLRLLAYQRLVSLIHLRVTSFHYMFSRTREMFWQYGGHSFGGCGIKATQTKGHVHLFKIHFPLGIAGRNGLHPEEMQDKASVLRYRRSSADESLFLELSSSRTATIMESGPGEWNKAIRISTFVTLLTGYFRLENEDEWVDRWRCRGSRTTGERVVLTGDLLGQV